MAVQMLGIKTKFTDDQGRPLVGGSVHTYYAGTSLPQDTFSDPELTVPNTNPVKLDDTGSANIFLKGTYRVRVFDIKGKFVEEQDNVDQLATVAEVFKNKGGLNAANERIDALTSEVNSVKEKTIIVESIADLSTIKNPKNGLRVYVKSYHAGLGKGGGYFTYDSSKTSTNDYGYVINGWVRDDTKRVSVLDFGAKGDGVTDDTQAIQSAIDYVYSRVTPYNVTGGHMYGGGEVFLPTGRYKVTKVIRAKGRVSLKGDGMMSTMIDSDPSLEYCLTNRIDGDDGTSHNKINISDIGFIQAGAYFLLNGQSFMRNVSFFNIRGSDKKKAGLLLQLTVCVNHENLLFFNCDTGIAINGNAGIGPSTTCNFYNIRVAHCDVGFAAQFSKNELMTTAFRDCVFEYNKKAIGLEGLITSIIFEGTHFEQNREYALTALLHPKSKVVIRDTWSDITSDYVFYNRNDPEDQRSVLDVSGFIGPAKLLIQTGARLDVIERDDSINYTSVPSSVRRFGSSGTEYSRSVPSALSYKKGDYGRNSDPDKGEFAEWTCIVPGIACDVLWKSLTAVQLGDRVTSGGNVYEATQAGVTGSSPISGTAQSIDDGTVKWKYLATRARFVVTSKVAERNSGTYTRSGSGVTGVVIPHGITGTPSYFNVTPASADAIATPIKSFYADSTNLVVTFSSPLPTGSNNITLVWVAEA